MTFVDLSHEIRDGMAVFPGLDPPRIGAVVDHGESRPQYEGQAEPVRVRRAAGEV